MIRIDTNKIIDAISMKLDSFFNSEEDEKYTIYGEEIRQGLKEPCFFIKLLKPSVKQIVGNRYFKSLPFDIHYFPENKNQKENEMWSICDEMQEALEYIEYSGELFRGSNINAEIIDDVLHFFVNFDYYFVKEKPKESYIQDLEYNLSTSIYLMTEDGEYLVTESDEKLM